MKNRPSPLTLSRLRKDVRALCGRDPSLRRIVRMYGYPPLWSRRPGFQTLVRIILEQQVSLASGKAIYERLRDSIGGLTPKRIVRRGSNGLRRLGVTRQKSAYLVALADLLVSGQLNLARLSRLPDEQARSILLTVKGIGPWTADVYLVMALRRPDVWPTGDLALHVALERFCRLCGRPTTEQAATFALRWRPFRAAAARILWLGYLASAD